MPRVIMKQSISSLSGLGVGVADALSADVGTTNGMVLTSAMQAALIAYLGEDHVWTAQQSFADFYLLDNGTATYKAVDIFNGSIRVNGTAIGGGSLTVTEVDNAPSVAATTIKFPNGSVTDNGSGVVTVNAVGATGATGATGAAGPNTVSTSTSTNITGVLYGNGTTVAAATAAERLGSVTKAELNTAVSDGNVQFVGDGLNGTLGATTPASVAATTGAFSGQITNTLNGAASTPPVLLTGTWFTGGTSTTTKPQLLIEPTGTTSTGWNTNGTGLGLNANSSYFGDFISMQRGGVVVNTLAWNGITSTGQISGSAVSSTGAARATTNLELVAPTSPFLVYVSSDNTLNTVSIRRGTNGQSLRIYGTSDLADGAVGSGGSNYRRLVIGMTSAGAASITAEGLGTGASGNNLSLSSSGKTFLNHDSGNGWLYIQPNGNLSSGLIYCGGNQFRVASDWTLYACSTTDAGGTVDTSFSRSSAGVWKMGTGGNNALGSLLLTNLTASGTVTVGSGTPIARVLSATATLDFPSIASNDTHTLTITVTGAVAGDSVFLGVPAALDAGLIFCASVTATNTVTVRMHNSSGGSTDPASATFRATVMQF